MQWRYYDTDYFNNPFKNRAKHIAKCLKLHLKVFKKIFLEHAKLQLQKNFNPKIRKNCIKCIYVYAHRRRHLHTYVYVIVVMCRSSYEVKHIYAAGGHFLWAYLYVSNNMWAYFKKLFISCSFMELPVVFHPRNWSGQHIPSLGCQRRSCASFFCKCTMMINCSISLWDSGPLCPMHDAILSLQVLTYRQVCKNIHIGIL